MKFKLWQSHKDQQWYFTLVADNGEPVAQSEGYTTREAALKGVRAVKKCRWARIEYV